MNIKEFCELAEVLGRVRDWSPSLRIALAKEILDSLQPAIATTAATTAPLAGSAAKMIGIEDAPDLSGRSHWGLSAEELQGLLETDRPAPDDETVERWIDEHRTGKYA